MELFQSESIFLNDANVKTYNPLFPHDYHPTINRTDPKIHCDTDDFILNHPLIKPLLAELDSIIPPNEPPKYDLNTENFGIGLKGYPFPDKRDAFLSKTVDGWSIIKDDNAIGKGATKNCPMSVKDIAHSLKKIIGALRKNAAWGPFTEETLPDSLSDAVYPPIFVIDQNEKKRMINNLSHGKHSGKSLNCKIEKDEKDVDYATFIFICTWLVVNCIVWLFAIDMMDAYHRVPVLDKHIRHLGMRICGRIIFWTCLIFGLSSACQIYTEFADFVCWIICNSDLTLFWNGIYYLLIHYLDDFLGGAKTEAIAWCQFKLVIWWLSFLNLPTQDRKCSTPNRTLEWVGYIWSTLNPSFSSEDLVLPHIKSSNPVYTVRVPQRKIERSLQDCHWLLFQRKTKKRVRIHTLQTITGRLRSFQNIYIYMIPFLRRLEEVAASFTNNQHFTKIDGVMERDIKVIIEFLLDSKHNRMDILFILRPRDAADITIYTDASTSVGVGGYIHREGGDYFKMFWRDCFEFRQNDQPDIVWMELAGLVISCLLFASRWNGRCIHFYCDNMAVVRILIRKRACSYRKDLNDLVRVICGTASVYHWKFWVDHVEGVNNPTADALSRGFDFRNTVEFKLSDIEIDCAVAVNDCLRLFKESKTRMRSIKKEDICACNVEKEDDLCDLQPEYSI